MKKVIASILISTSALFSGDLTEEMLEAFHNAGKFYNVNPVAPMTIGKIESGFNPLARNVNKNGTVDMGLMQINSAWLPDLKRYGLTDPAQLYDPIYNIFVGTWILRGCYNRFGQSWRTVDCYNKGPGNATGYGRYVLKFSEHMRDMETTYSSFQTKSKKPTSKTLQQQTITLESEAPQENPPQQAKPSYRSLANID